MADRITVKALRMGFYGELREAGAVFTVPAGETASWWVEVGAAPKVEAVPVPPANSEPVKLEAMTVKELRAYAKEKGIGLEAGVTTKAEIIDTIYASQQPQPPTAEPFAEAPPPVVISGDAGEAPSGPAPDWVSPGGEI